MVCARAQTPLTHWGFVHLVHLSFPSSTACSACMSSCVFLPLIRSLSEHPHKLGRMLMAPEFCSGGLQRPVDGSTWMPPGMGHAENPHLSPSHPFMKTAVSHITPLHRISFLGKLESLCSTITDMKTLSWLCWVFLRLGSSGWF